MALAFSDNVNNDGIVEQARIMARVDANQWPTIRIANSCNNYLDEITGYAITADRRFRWDDTNHSKLPEGKTDLILNQTDYSFLVDEQGNQILSLLGLSLVDTNGRETPLELVDRGDQDYDINLFGSLTGTPTQYDKISDNIVRLDRKPTSTDVASFDLKFRFQRSPSYFTAIDTTKEPGVASTLHRGFVVYSAYDIALTLGLPNLQSISVERAFEIQKMKDHFANRNMDEPGVITGEYKSYE